MILLCSRVFCHYVCFSLAYLRMRVCVYMEHEIVCVYVVYILYLLSRVCETCLRVDVLIYDITKNNIQISFAHPPCVRESIFSVRL